MSAILIIDDDNMLLNMAKQALIKFGYDVETAENGKEGIQKFDNGSFNLVITDMCMSHIDGNGVARHIRNSDKHQTPIIGISGTPWLFNVNSFDAVIPKPFTIKVLIDSVKTLL